MKYNQRIFTAIIISVALLLITFSEYYWSQIFGVLIAIALILVFGLTSMIKLITTGITVYQLRNQLTIRIVLPTIIYLTTFGIIYVDPGFMNIKPDEGATIYRGCYEGTQNTGVIYFMESGKFEYRHGGTFGSSTYRDGTWIQVGDTLLITYTNNEVHEFVGEKLLIAEDRFIKIHTDGLQDNRRGFYRGYCKGLN